MKENPVPRDILIFLQTKVFPHTSPRLLESLLQCSRITLLQEGEEQRKPGLYIVYSGSIAVDSQLLTVGDYVVSEHGVRAVEEAIVIYADYECARPVLALGEEEPCLVGDLIYRDPVVVGPDTPVIEAVKKMYREGVSSIIVVDKDGRPLGIFTDTDLRRLVALGEELSRQISAYMTPQPLSIRASATCMEAAFAMMNRYVKHIVVVDDSGRVSGVVTVRDIAYAEALGPLYMLRRIRSASSVDELALRYRELVSLLRREARRLHPSGGGREAVHMVRMASLALRGVMSKAAELAARELGLPGDGLAYLSLGSNGRLEQFLASDRDTMLVYWGVDEQRARVFAERVEDILDRIGFPGCRHGYTSRRLLYSRDELLEKLSSMAGNPRDENIVLLSMMFDAVDVWGQHGAAEWVRRSIAELLSRSSSYIMGVLPAYRPKLGFAGRLPRELDLKAHGLAPVVYTVKAFAIAETVWEPVNTLDRLMALVAKGAVPSDLAADVAEAYRILSAFMVWLQALHGGTRIDTGELSGFERSILRSALRTVQRFVDYARRRG